MNVWLRRLTHQPLVARLLLVSLTLLLVVQAASFWTVRSAMDEQVRAEIEVDLALGHRVWERLLEQNASRLFEASVVLAADFGFRSAIATGDRDTIASALENNGERIGASIAALLNPDFSLVSASEGSGDQTKTLLSTLPVLGARLAEQLGAGSLLIVDGNAYQFVMAPVRAPLTIGWVVMGFPLNQALVDDMERLTGLQVVLSVSQPPNPPHITLATVAQAKVPALQEMIGARATEVAWQDSRWIVRHIAPEAMGATLQVALMRSLDEVAAPFYALQWTLGIITVAGLVLFGVGSTVGIRFVTRPLIALTEVAGALRQGQFDVTVPGTQRKDEVGALARSFDLMRTSIAEQREEILRLAYWDRLTGLPNREQFRQTLKDAITGARDVAKPLVVITLNLNRFKLVNDVLGYGFGDELLKAVAHRLTEQVYRQGDLVARLGGDEFAILLTRSNTEGAIKITQRITEAFEVPLALNDQTVDMHASMGVACWPADASDADELMSRSEIAMHAAKTTTDNVLLYSPALDSSSTQTLSLLSDLRHALQNNELRLFLQPKLDVQSGKVVAAESLVRWQHPVRGLVPPLQFIPFAEQTGFVRQLTLWMFEEAARLLAQHRTAHPGLRIAINLSTRDLLDLDFPQRLSSLMQHYGVGGPDFCLEITESAIMDDPQRAENTLNQLAALNFKLSIDDFGTGYSSLAYLKRLPVSELKIDKSFVMGMVDDDSDAKIVRSTVDLAHNLGLSVVAEGVENQAILDKLRELACDEAQGYHISRPMPASDFVVWLQDWNGRASAQ